MAVVARGEFETASYKSWAQQTEESYQLQLALALRVSSEATCADDPNFLDTGTDDRPPSAEVVSHRFWVTGCLSYFDKVPDGLYLIHGMDPYTWNISTELQEYGRVPSFESLKAIDPFSDFPIEVILIDKSRDPGLKELVNRALNLSSSWMTKNDLAVHLAELVSDCMGGIASSGEDCFLDRWKNCTSVLKDCLRSVVLPIGSLSVGFCVHRAVLFKVLADSINLPCRIVKGCKYCRRDCACSCLVRFGLGREYLVDLIGRPGFICQPDSFCNGASSISISSPLCHPRYKSVESGENFRTLAKLYFSDGQSINITFDDASSGTAIDQENMTAPFPNSLERNNLVPVSRGEYSASALPQRALCPINHVRDFQMQNSHNPFLNVTSSTDLNKGTNMLGQIQPSERRDTQPVLAFSDPRTDAVNKSKFSKGNHSATGKVNPELSFVAEDFDIPWSDLDLKKKIGAGSFGTVHLAKWCGLDVAIKILMQQDFHAEHFREFLSEVEIMKRLRHPNIVLFMGAVTQPPHLSIVTEYLSRGSLYELLHKPDAGVELDETCRLNMAYDVAKGMTYLHQLKPPIVHRDLKSPNLLVDDNYRVKVCDFGLSRPKANTFLSSKSTAGTPQWMAPEVLRDERSDEKSDVYSFGIILWELVTLQKPWRNLDTYQVVAAVGFRGRRPEIPSTVNPQVAALIEACWADEPKKRPPFSLVMEALHQLILYSRRHSIF